MKSLQEGFEMAKNKSPKEHIEQVTFLNEFKKEWPDVFIHSIPNGGYKHISVAKTLKLEGLEAGIPDLFVPEWCLWPEMKRQIGGVLSPEQVRTIKILEKAGHIVIVCTGYIDALNQIRDLHSKNQLDIKIVRG
jgi:hypothetical protein